MCKETEIPNPTSSRECRNCII